MKKKTRILTLLLSTVVAASYFTGCGDINADDSGKHLDNSNATNVELAIWNSGSGTKWLDNMIEAFEDEHPEYHVTYNASASINTVNASFGMEDVDNTDLYLTYVSYDTEHMEPLDDVLTATADGETKTIGEKFHSTYIAGAQAKDGHYYTLSFRGGVIGFVYNKEIFEKAGIRQLPRTTDELVVVCDTLYSSGYTPLCHFYNGGYYTYLDQAFMAQYDGVGYYVNNFYGCTDAAGNSPSIGVLTAKDGRYYALKAYEEFITPEYTLTGSNTKSHTEIQTEFLNDRAAMMLNGSWMEYEMKGIGSVEKFAMMRLPVLSDIVNKLTTVKSEKLLRELVTAIDQVTSKEKELSDFASGDDYIVGGQTVSAEDWAYVSAARNTVSSNFAGEVAYIPKYSNAKEGAKEFLKFLYSDRGLKIYAETVQSPRPISLSTGEEIDISGFSNFAKSQYELLASAENLVDLHFNHKHEIFLHGGAQDFAGVSFIDKFSTNNAADRKTAEEVWKLVIDTIEDKYETTWLKNIK